MQPRLNHFVVRPDTKDGMPGPIVPLIAVDQLPDWMQVAGVPRELDAEQTIGLTNLGVVEMEEDSFFEVRLHHDKIRAILNRADETTDLYSSGNEKARVKAAGHKRKASLRETKSKTNDKAASNDSLPTSPSVSRHNIANTVVDVQARSSSSNERSPRPRMKEATRDESRPNGPQRTTARQYKQPITAFCRHWCCHGTCKWGMKCRYVHRMPTTVEGLREVGLKDFPTWYLLMMSDAGSGASGLSRMDALLEPDSPWSNKQELKQIREMLHLLLHGAQPTHGQQQSRPQNNNNNNYANLYTNASVAANVASIRQQAERQQQARDNMLVTRVRPRVKSNVEDGRDGGGDGGRILLPATKGGRASNECAGVVTVRSPGFVARRAGFGEGKLVDID